VTNNGVSTECGCTTVRAPGSGRAVNIIIVLLIEFGTYTSAVLSKQLLHHFLVVSKRFKVLSGRSSAGWRITGSECFQRMWAGDDNQWIILEWPTRTYFKPNQAQHPQLQHSTGSAITTCNLYKQGTYECPTVGFAVLHVFFHYPHSLDLVPDLRSNLHWGW